MIKLANAKLLRDIIISISTLLDEATFDISLDKIKLRAMDPSRVAMVDFEWPKALFDEYVCSEAMKMCVNITELLKLLRRSGTNESVELSFDESTGKLRLTIKGKYERTFSMSTIEAFEEEVPIPKVSFNSKVEVMTNAFRQALADVSLVSDYVSIDVNTETMTMQASGDLMGANIQLKKGDDVLLSLDAKEPSKATFSLSYLSEIVKAAAATSEIASVEFSTDMPIRLDFKQQQNGKLIFYLAPRIEVD